MAPDPLSGRFLEGGEGSFPFIAPASPLTFPVAANPTGELGFEPRLSDPESLVLPLHHSPDSSETGTSADGPTRVAPIASLSGRRSRKSASISHKDLLCLRHPDSEAIGATRDSGAIGATLANFGTADTAVAHFRTKRWNH